MSSSNKCSFCSKTVYFNEAQFYNGGNVHEDCFRCKTCRSRLVAGKHVDHENAPYCQSCYDKQIRPKGFGFGVNTVDSFVAPTQNNTQTAKPAAAAAPAPAAKAAGGFCVGCGAPRVAGNNFCGSCGHKH